MAVEIRYGHGSPASPRLASYNVRLDYGKSIPLTSDPAAPDPEVVKEIDELGTMLQRLKTMENAPTGPTAVYEASAMRKDLRYQSYQRRRGKA
ncbi:MAG: hypothetical protein M1553_00165 [Firmicutes bacterium]|nr:hypothetical protein [Bacillota bacterium]